MPEQEWFIMLKSYDVGHQHHKPRTKYFLTAGGRVVRVDHDPDAGNRLMVPTEDELKTILYDQVSNGRHTQQQTVSGNIPIVSLCVLHSPACDAYSTSKVCGCRLHKCVTEPPNLPPLLKEQPVARRAPTEPVATHLAALSLW